MWIISKVVSVVSGSARWYLLALALGAFFWWQASRIDDLKASLSDATTAASMAKDALKAYKFQAELDIKEQARLRIESEQQAARARDQERKIRNDYKSETDACAPSLCNTLERLRYSGAGQR